MLKKQHTEKNNEEAAEHAKLLAKRMKVAKEKDGEQIAKRWRMSSLRTSEYSQKLDVVRVINCCFFTKLCLTLCNSMDCSPPGSSVRGIFQERILKYSRK